MPKTEIHIESSAVKTGKGYHEVHQYVDNPVKKAERHDITRMCEMSAMFEAEQGHGASQELIQHIHDDMYVKFDDLVKGIEKRSKELVDDHLQMFTVLKKTSNSTATDLASEKAREDLEHKLSSLVRETNGKIRDILAYFGVASGKKVFTYKTKGEDIALLRKAGVKEEDIQHSLKVAQKALEIASRSGSKLDFELIGRGALFHDLGKAKTHDIEHGKIGEEIGRSLGLPTPITDIMEKHIRGGLTEEEAVELGLPVKDYQLRSLEERIVIYADRMVDIIMDGVVEKEEDAEKRFEEILSTNTKYGKNEKTLKRYLGYHNEIQGLMR